MLATHSHAFYIKFNVQRALAGRFSFLFYFHLMNLSIYIQGMAIGSIVFIEFSMIGSSVRLLSPRAQGKLL